VETGSAAQLSTEKKKRFTKSRGRGKGGGGGIEATRHLQRRAGRIGKETGKKRQDPGQEKTNYPVRRDRGVPTGMHWRHPPVWGTFQNPIVDEGGTAGPGRKGGGFNQGTDRG